MIQVLKGVNKKVVEVTNPENEYFERVIFILKDSAGKDGESQLAQRATQYIEGACQKTKAVKNWTPELAEKKRKRQFCWGRVILLSGMGVLILLGVLLFFLL